MAYILIVDDDIDIITASSLGLKAAGHEVSYELDIESAEKSMHARKPDLIILDVMFPESDLYNLYKYSDLDSHTLDVLINYYDGSLIKLPTKKEWKTCLMVTLVYYLKNMKKLI